MIFEGSLAISSGCCCCGCDFAEVAALLLHRPARGGYCGCCTLLLLIVPLPLPHNYRVELVYQSAAAEDQPPVVILNCLGWQNAHAGCGSAERRGNALFLIFFNRQRKLGPRKAAKKRPLFLPFRANPKWVSLPGLCLCWARCLQSDKMGNKAKLDLKL